MTGYKRASQSREMSLCRCQSLKTALNGHDLWDLRCHWIKNRHNSVMNITAQAWAHLRWTEEKWETVLWSDKFIFLFGKGLCVLHSKEEWDHLACYQGTVQNPAFMMVWGGALVQSFHICESSISVERYTQVLAQQMLPSRQQLLQGRQARQCQTTFCKRYSSMAQW